jgi:hypothetical protein
MARITATGPPIRAVVSAGCPATLIARTQARVKTLRLAIGMLVGTIAMTKIKIRRRRPVVLVVVREGSLNEAMETAKKMARSLRIRVKKRVTGPALGSEMRARVMMLKEIM